MAAVLRYRNEVVGKAEKKKLKTFINFKSTRVGCVLLLFLSSTPPNSVAAKQKQRRLGGHQTKHKPRHVTTKESDQRGVKMYPAGERLWWRLISLAFGGGCAVFPRRFLARTLRCAGWEKLDHNVYTFLCLTGIGDFGTHKLFHSFRFEPIMCKDMIQAINRSKAPPRRITVSKVVECECVKTGQTGVALGKIDWILRCKRPRRCV